MHVKQNKIKYLQTNNSYITSERLVSSCQPNNISAYTLLKWSNNGIFVRLISEHDYESELQYFEFTQSQESDQEFLRNSFICTLTVSAELDLGCDD